MPAHKQPESHPLDLTTAADTKALIFDSPLKFTAELHQVWRGEN